MRLDSLSLPELQRFPYLWSAWGCGPHHPPFTSRPEAFPGLEAPPFPLYLPLPYKNQVSLINSFPSIARTQPAATGKWVDT